MACAVKVSYFLIKKWFSLICFFTTTTCCQIIEKGKVTERKKVDRNKSAKENITETCKIISFD